MHSRRVTWQSNFWNLLPIVKNVTDSRATVARAERGDRREGKDLEGGRGRVGIKGVQRAFPGFSLARLD